MLTHMKTTIELPDDLMARAKVAAAERRTTLKAMMEHALRRELMESADSKEASAVELNAFGFPVLRSPMSSDQVVTSEIVYQLMDEEDDESGQLPFP